METEKPDEPESHPEQPAPDQPEKPPTITVEPAGIESEERVHEPEHAGSA